MARSLFGGTDDDRVEIVWVFGARRIPTLANQVTVTFYDAEEGGNQVTDLALNADGTSPVTAMTTDGDGYLGAFYGPDLVTSLWAQAGDSPRRFLMTTTDSAAVAAAADRAEQAALDAEASAASVAREQPGGVAGLDAAGLIYPERLPDAKDRPDLSNYVLDPDMQDLGTWTAIQGSISFPAVSTGPDGGTDQVLRFAETSGVAQDAREPRFPVSAGQTFYMRAWLRRQLTAPTAGTIYLTIYCYDSTGTVMAATPAGNVVTISAANVLAADGSYHEGSVTIPAGAVEAQVSIRLSSTITSGALFDADRVEVRHMVQERHVGDAAIKERHLDPILLDDLARVAFRPVNVREAYGTDDTSVRAALADAQAGGRALYFPAGNYYATGDLSFDMDGLHLWGDGSKTQINLTDGAVLLDGFSSAHLMRPSLRDITIVRTGTGGAALYAKGAGTGTGVARLTASNLDLSSANGAAMQYEGSYIAAFHGCYFRNSLTGIRMKLEAATNTVGANLVSFFGGEAQGNTGSGVHLSDCRGVSFYGFGIEGNGGNLSSAGARVDGDSHSVNFKDCYLELNKGTVDIDIAPSNTDAGPFIVEGCTFYDYTAEKNQIVYFRNGHCFANYNRFNDLSADTASRAIRVDAPVIGEARHNWVVSPQGGQLYGISGSNTTFTTAG